jgi:hypothetical protein
MSQPLIDAVTEELDTEYKERQTVTSKRHDEIARWLAMRSSVVELQLFLNGQVRRGFVEDDQRYDMQRHLDRLTREVAERLEGAKGK